MKKPLYQIEQDYLAIAAALEDGELTPELEQSLAITEHELEVKAVGYGHIILEADHDIDAIDAEIKRLTALKKSATAKRDRLKDAISNAMQHFGIQKIDSPTLKLSFRKSEAVVGEGELPDDLTTLVPETRKPNLTAVKAAIKEGREVQGWSIDERYNLQVK